MTRKATTIPEACAVPRDRGATVAWSDEQLLRQFRSRTDEPAEAAFAILIERHGPLVLRVCLDVLRDPEEARDAAQAVFLVLARKAQSIRKPEALGPWLHGVALRLGRRARCEAARRRTAERRRAEMLQSRQAADETPDPLGDAELHEEVDRLPEKYRKPIILCYLQGRTQAEAAELLGWPLGTVQIRLHRGRDQLRTRLLRRGAGTLGLAGLGLGLARSATAGVSGKEWIEATAAAAVKFAAGKATAGLVAPGVTRLAESALAAMFRLPLQVVAAVAIGLLLVSAAVPLTGLPTRAVTLTRTHGLPVRPLAAPKLLAQAVPSAPLVTTSQTVNLSDRERRGLEEKPNPRASLRDALTVGGVRRSPISTGRSQGLPRTGRDPGAAPERGRELFERVWVADDPRGHGGDGLGPVFNATSCVACHHLGGTGGAGGIDGNIEIATLTEPLAEGTGFNYAFSMDFGSGRFSYRMGNVGGNAPRPERRLDPGLLATIHPGFRQARSVVLHRYGTDPAYNAWRGTVPGPHGTILIRTAERNPPPLFGAGLIEAIPDAAIEAAARRKFPGSSSAKGRVSRLEDGRIGRFGWKAQTATLKEFILSAAAGEIGLEVPGRRQAADPRLPGLGASGLDLDEAECDDLTNYVRRLPAPVANKPAGDQESAQQKSGEDAFKAIGCAHCHLPRLGEVEGIYSDLLLHDMSPRLGDADAYAVFVGDQPRADGGQAPDRAAGATILEWRTPPLWGLRDSGPYLHDGRATSIDQAVTLHAGQGAASARRYGELSPRRKRHLAAFLMSLAAPSPKK